MSPCDNELLSDTGSGDSEARFGRRGMTYACLFVSRSRVCERVFLARVEKEVRVFPPAFSPKRVYIIRFCFHYGNHQLVAHEL